MYTWAAQASLKHRPILKVNIFFSHLTDVQKEMKAKQLKKTENILMSYQALFFSLSALWGLHLKFNNW